MTPEQQTLLSEIGSNQAAIQEELKALSARCEKGDATVAGLEQKVTSATKEKFDNIDKEFVTLSERMKKLDELNAKREMEPDNFERFRNEHVEAHFADFNEAVLSAEGEQRGGTPAGVPQGGFTEIKQYQAYENAFKHCLSKRGMRLLEERHGSASDTVKMAKELRKAVFSSLDDSTQANGGALVPEAFTAKIEQVARLMSPILGKVKTVPTSINEVERILATTTSVQRGRGAGRAGDPLRGSRGGTGDSNPMFYEQRVVVGDVWSRPYVHEDTLEDSVATIDSFLLDGVARDFAAEEAQQCIAGNGAVTNGVLADTDGQPWQGIFGGTGIQSQVVDGTVANFNAYADANRFKPVVRVKSGTFGALGSLDSSAANNLYDDLVDLQLSILLGYRTPMSCFVGSTAMLTAIRKLKDADGRPVFDMDRAEKGVYRPMVMGREFVEAEHAPDPGPATGATVVNSTSPLAYGDFMQGYTRVKRRGLRMRMLDHEPPYVSFYFSARNRGMVFDNRAFSLYRLQTTS